MNNDAFDLNDAEAVRVWLGIPQFALPAWCLKLFPTMGDRAAVVILKALYPYEEINRVKLDKILVALRQSFKYPAMIRDKWDVHPAVTICLLEWLKGRTPNSSTAIEALIAEINSVTP